MANRNDKIQFDCPECEHTIRTSAGNAGRKGKCPKCQTTFRIPKDASTASPRVRSKNEAPTNKPEAAQPKATPSADGELSSANEVDGNLDFNFDDIDEIISREKAANQLQGTTESPAPTSSFEDLPDTFEPPATLPPVQNAPSLPPAPNVRPAPIPGFEDVPAQPSAADLLPPSQSPASTPPPVPPPAQLDPNVPHDDRMRDTPNAPIEIIEDAPLIEPKLSANPSGAPATDDFLIDASLVTDEEDQFDIQSVARDIEMPDNVPASMDGRGVDPDDTSTIGFHKDENFDLDSAFGISCHICDTRIHVTPDKIGKEVPCPICYTKVTVKNPKAPKIAEWELGKKNLDSIKSQFGDDAEAAIEPDAEDDELRLVEPDERPKSDLAEIPENFGFDSVTDDLLTPMAQPESEFASEVWDDNPPPLEIIEDLDPAEMDQPTAQTGAAQPPPANYVQPTRQPAPQPTAQPTQATQPTAQSRPKGRRSAPSGTSQDKPKRSRREKYEEVHHDEIHDEPDIKPGVIDKDPISIERLAQTAVQFLASVFVRLMPAIVAFGASGMLWDAFATLPEASFGQKMFWGALQFLIAGPIWIAGTFLLMYISGTVFRHAAYGHKEVQKWKTPKFAEVRDTTLLVGLSFVGCGLPVAMFTWFVTAFRFFVSPMLLLGVWFNQSAYMVVAPEAFKYMLRDKREWMMYYLFVAGLALLSFISGFMFWSSIGLLAIFAAPIYASVVVCFFAVTGWHAGRVVDRFEHGPAAQPLETRSEAGSGDARSREAGQPKSGPQFESEMDG